MRFRTAVTAGARLTCLSVVAALVMTSCGDGATVECEGGAGSPEGYPLTMENCGHEITFEAPPERVTLLESAPVTILDGIGVFDRVRSRAGHFPLEYYDDELARKVQDVEAFSEDMDASGHLMISEEVVVAQSPDLVLGLPDGVTRAGLADAGAMVLTQELYCEGSRGETSFDDLYAEIDRYGRIFDRAQEAETLNAELSDRVAAVEGRTRDEDRSAAVLYPSAGGGPLYTYGTASMAHPQLAAAGFENVFADIDERVFEVQTEELITRDPDVLIVLYQGAEQDAEDALSRRSGLGVVSAVSEGDVYYQLFNFTEPASPLAVDGLESIAEHFNARG
ncbi:ABC transporter substrate-binding protein [Nocardiopsis sp. NPDC006832]|uniref:ABC transporter substrate-binding protein n=1 Tax=Nocardiopsis sp. NPDC006832 TaxID=3157188 RepID=UPI0033E08EF5